MELSSRLKTIIEKYFLSLKLNFRARLWQLGCCDLCNGPCQHHPLLCQTCLDDLTVFGQDRVQYDLLNWPIIEQAMPKIQFDHLLCLAPYIWPFTQWMPQFKYQGRFELANLFAVLLSELWSKRLANQAVGNVVAVFCVPLHINKWQQRGYNQAHLIARAFAKEQDYAYFSAAITRVRKTVSQVGQTGGQRRKNLRHAFALNIANSELPEHVLLIDDVVTTGSTASEISVLLKAAGVKTVTLITVCLTLPKI